MSKQTEFTLRMMRMCPTCACEINIESRMVENSADYKFLAMVIETQMRKLDESYPRLCPKCSKKKGEWSKVECVYFGVPKI